MASPPVKPPAAAALGRSLGRLNGLTPWQRPLRPLRTVARRLLLRAYPPATAGRWSGAVAPLPGGGRMAVDPRSYVEWEVLFAGYEPEVRELLRRALGPGALAVDVGANAGAHTLAMAATGARVIAVEPNPGLRARLEANLELNGLHEVRVAPVALGAQPGTATLHVPADPVHTGGASLVAGIHEHLRGAVEVSVEVTTLDALLETDDVPRLVKIDVEGFEAAVLAGGARTLERHRPDLAFEYTREWWHAAGSSLEPVLARLRELGYDIRMVTWRGLRPIPAAAPERMNVWASVRRTA